MEEGWELWGVSQENPVVSLYSHCQCYVCKTMSRYSRKWGKKRLNSCSIVGLSSAQRKFGATCSQQFCISTFASFCVPAFLSQSLCSLNPPSLGFLRSFPIPLCHYHCIPSLWMVNPNWPATTKKCWAFVFFVSQGECLLCCSPSDANAPCGKY